MDDDDSLEVYTYRGNVGEKVPQRVEKLIVAEGVQVLPDEFCSDYLHLQEVTLPKGLVKIGDSAFESVDLSEIKIGSSVQVIGKAAFQLCDLLQKVEFETSTSPPYQRLQSIDIGAFEDCDQLPRIKLPSSVTSVFESAFFGCGGLIEADLSTTGLAEICYLAFANCSSLRTVSLPITLVRICNSAFWDCVKLTTVVIPLRSRYLKFGSCCFNGCRRLANLVLPENSTTEAYTFRRCRRLHERFSEDRFRIVKGLTARFGNLPVHRMCYDHSAVTVDDLRKGIAEQQGHSLLDMFGMTPLHVLFSTPSPRVELLEVLLESLPNRVLRCKDVNGKRPSYYLTSNWTDGTSRLLHRTLQKWMIEPLSRWGDASWMDAMQSKVQAIVAENDMVQRRALLQEAYSTIEHYENVQITSILEMALWKWKLKSGRISNNGTKRQALDRDVCRCLCGSDVVVPSIVSFLGIPRTND